MLFGDLDDISVYCSSICFVSIFLSNDLWSPERHYLTFLPVFDNLHGSDIISEGVLGLCVWVLHILTWIFSKWLISLTFTLP